MAPRTQQELQLAFAERVHFLHSHSIAFDRGIDAEAKALAIHLRVLFHATSKSKALIDSLGMRGSFSMYDTSSPLDPDGSVTGQSTLTTLAVRRGRYVATLDVREARFVDFDEWWKRPIVINADGKALTRESLVVTMADQDGAHVDPELNAVYSTLLSEGIGLRGSKDSRPLTPLFAAVRQIAHESLVSFAHSHTPFPDTVSRRRYRYLPGPELPEVYGEDTYMSGMKPVVENLDGTPYVHAPNAGWPDTIGRNDPCPCGNGKKFKHCHGC